MSRMLKYAAIAAVCLGAVAGGTAWAGDEAPTELKIGNLAPYSGPASAYSLFAKVEAAYFRMVNEQGGINGRPIRFISYDDAYSPPKSVEMARKLVENDDVLMIFHSVGTPTNVAIMKYMNAKKVPQLFAGSGVSKLADPENFPWTMGFATSAYRLEAAIYAKYLLENRPDARIAVLYQNDDLGKDLLGGLHEGLGDKADEMIVAEASYELTDPLITSQITSLKHSGADTLLSFSTPRFSAMAIRQVAEFGWKPLQIVSTSGSSITSVMKVAGIENAMGVMSANSLKDPADPRWNDDPGMRRFIAFMDKYDPEGSKDYYTAVGYIAAQALQHVLEKSGDDLSRSNIMKQAASIEDLQLDMLLPGISVSTSATNFNPISHMQLQRFNGEGWDPVGDVMSASLTN